MMSGLVDEVQQCREMEEEFGTAFAKRIEKGNEELYRYRPWQIFYAPAIHSFFLLFCSLFLYWITCELI
jgi:hypothetical protein